jgi:hypothetical protein
VTWLQTVLLVLRLLDTLGSWLRERQLIKAGEADATAEAMGLANGRIKKALDARRRANNADPDPGDPYLRD